MKRWSRLLILSIFLVGCGETAPSYKITGNVYNDTTYNYTEKDGCVEYIDVSGRPNKVCGPYTILAQNGAILKLQEYKQQLSNNQKDNQ